jgi:hypothetical protein
MATGFTGDPLAGGTVMPAVPPLGSSDTLAAESESGLRPPRTRLDR